MRVLKEIVWWQLTVSGRLIIICSTWTSELRAEQNWSGDQSIEQLLLVKYLQYKFPQFPSSQFRVVRCETYVNTPTTHLILIIVILILSRSQADQEKQEADGDQLRSWQSHPVWLLFWKFVSKNDDSHFSRDLFF